MILSTDRRRNSDGKTERQRDGQTSLSGGYNKVCTFIVSYLHFYKSKFYELSQFSWKIHWNCQQSFFIPHALLSYWVQHTQCSFELLGTTYPVLFWVIGETYPMLFWVIGYNIPSALLSYRGNLPSALLSYWVQHTQCSSELLGHSMKLWVFFNKNCGKCDQRHRRHRARPGHTCAPFY